MDRIGDEALAPRIMMYSQDGLGLGHMRRTNSLAGQLLRRRPGAAILTLTDSRLGQFFGAVPNQDYIKLPSIKKVGPGDWRTTNLPMPFAAVQELRQEVIRCAVLRFQPHILLVDHMPHGAMGELLPALQLLRAAGIETRVVLGLRDILDAPEVVQRRWEVEGAYEAITQYYDLVLVYGQRDVFDLAAQYRFPPEVERRLRYCGYVCAPTPPRHGPRIRARYLAGTAEGTRLIVMMAGGGDDAYPMMSAVLDALPAIQARQPCVLVQIAGPFMAAERRRDLQARARGTAAHVLTSIDDTPSYIAAADLVVAMAGYNTTTEILRWGKRPVLIPRPGPSAEQRMRARLFAGRGWITMVDPTDLNTAAVAEAVCAGLQQNEGATRQRKPDLRGRSTAADHLLALLPPPLAAHPPLPPLDARAQPAELVAHSGRI
jgi:predicted glycosyltransferase